MHNAMCKSLLCVDRIVAHAFTAEDVAVGTGRQYTLHTLLYPAVDAYDTSIITIVIGTTATEVAIPNTRHHAI